MTDRKQGAGLSSGSSAAVHKAHSWLIMHDSVHLCLITLFSSAFISPVFSLIRC